MSPINLENCNQITTNLFLGGMAAGLQTQALKDQGIHAVVCCLRELEFPSCDFHKDLEYYRIDVEDIGREPIELFWPEATEFIHACITQGQPVLVHCRAGVSRSASTVIAYLVQYQGYSLYDAFVLARTRRPVVTPNLGFMQKLCDFEAQEHSIKPTISMAKYSSWFSGSQLDSMPDVAREDIKADRLAEERKKSEDAVTAPTQTTMVKPDVEIGVVQKASAVDSGMDQAAQVVPDDLAKQKAMIESPEDMKRVSTISSNGDDDDVRPVMSSVSTTSANHKAEIDRDLCYSDRPMVRERVDRIRAILVRHAARDPELGYCQGMHLVAALFAAVSNTQAAAYWRFDAFVGGIRGLWLPGFLLLQAGAAEFEELAQHRLWFQHMQDHNVEMSMYLPEAWLLLFASWLPLPILVECLELLEGHGFAGIVAMTLAMLDHAGEKIIEQKSAEDILQVLARLKEEQTPDATSLLKATRVWLPQVVATLAASYARVVTRGSAKVVEMSSQRDGSRVVVNGSVLDAPNLSPWVSAPVEMMPVLSSMVFSSEGLVSTTWAPTSTSSVSSCFSWCWPAPAPVVPAETRRPSASRTRRSSVKLADQKEARSFSLKIPTDVVEGTVDAEQAQKNQHARDLAQKRRMSVTWAARG